MNNVTCVHSENGPLVRVHQDNFQPGILILEVGSNRAELTRENARAIAEALNLDNAPPYEGEILNARCSDRLFDRRVVHVDTEKDVVVTVDNDDSRVIKYTIQEAIYYRNNCEDW